MSAQLHAFRKLIRIAARVFFLGDITDVTRDDPSLETPGKGRAKRNQISQKNLVVVVLDALTYREWVSVDKFAEQIHMSSKQVRRVLHYLEMQGFVVREHRREKRKGNRVESVDADDAAPEKGQTSSYVAIDYPHFFDMLRLRMHLAKKALDDKIDDRAAVKNYVCGANTDNLPGCGAKYTSFTIVGLPVTEKGLLRCNVCDFGIVEPQIAGKSAASWRLDRDVARSQRKELKEVLRELEEMVARLQDVDPPDFGSFTDWVQARKDKKDSGAAAAGGGREGGRGGGRSGGALDYGIDGPMSGDARINITSTGGAAGDGALLPQRAPADPRASLPYFMQQDHGTGTAAAAGGAGSASVTGAAENADDKDVQAAEQQAVYDAYVKQYLEQVAANLALQAKAEVKDDKDWKPADALQAAATPGLPQAGPSAVLGAAAAQPPAKRAKLDIFGTEDRLTSAHDEQFVPPPSPGEAPFPLPPSTPLDAAAEGGDAFVWEDAAPAKGQVPTPEDAFEWED